MPVTGVWHGVWTQRRLAAEGMYEIGNQPPNSMTGIGSGLSCCTAPAFSVFGPRPLVLTEPPACGGMADPFSMAMGFMSKQADEKRRQQALGAGAIQAFCAFCALCICFHARLSGVVRHARKEPGGGDGSKRRSHMNVGLKHRPGSANSLAGSVRGCEWLVGAEVESTSHQQLRTQRSSDC